MFSAFFGHYLLNEKVVTTNQLEQALERQDQVRLKLGTLAINAKLMTVDQVEEVHTMQLTCDQRFGELAMAAGYLTDNQLEELLSTQKSEHLLLAQSLVDLDILTFTEYETHLDNYKKQHELSDEKMEQFMSDDIETIINTYLSFEDDDNKSFYVDYVTLFIKNQVRFINSHIRLGKATLIKQKSYDHMICQTLKTNQKYFTALAGGTSSMMAFAGMYADEKFKVFGEYPIDAVGEYINQNNGLFIVNKTNEGLKLTMNIQTHIESPTIKPYRPLYDIPIYCLCGEIHLILGEL